MLDRLIVITAPDFIKNEAEIWRQLFDLGMQKLHVRKLGWNEKELIGLIEQVPVSWRKRIVIHHHTDIMQKTGLGGVHLSFQNKTRRHSTEYSVSYSVHNWAELTNIINECDYALISPVFDSISKNGYAHNATLLSMPSEFIGKRIFALGGINDQNINSVFQIGYYGATLLGYLWEEPTRAVNKWELILSNLNLQK
jgi:thiamine-phosphate pyrophosphorylase